MYKGYSKTTPIECNGVIKTAAEWGTLSGIDYITIISRIKRGWQSHDAIHKPVDETCIGLGRTMHGLSHLPEYDIWVGMIARCYNVNVKSYDRYGARGITVCDRWRYSFENFYFDMGQRPSKRHSIEREDNNGQYCKDNCKWATAKEQSNNTRRSRWLTAFGETKTLAQWCNHFQISHFSVLRRLKLDWTIEEALSTPIRTHKQYNKHST